MKNNVYFDFGLHRASIIIYLVIRNKKSSIVNPAWIDPRLFFNIINKMIHVI